MDGQLPKIMKLTPFSDEKVWGGEQLKRLKKIQSSSPIGETLEISTLRGQNATFQNQPLSDLVGELSFILKLIETTDNLSIQVHPDDAYAKVYEESKGKSECWLILNAEEGAGIYLGFKPGVTKSTFEKIVADGSSVNDFLNFYDVKAGDFFYVPAKTIHAIGAGVLLAEVQQSCGVTYRVWDWNRVGLDGKPRELHLQKALDVIEFDEFKNNEKTFEIKKDVLSKEGVTNLISHADFDFSVHKNQKEIKLGAKGPNGLINLGRSSVTIHREKMSVELAPLESALVTDSQGDVVNISSDDSTLGVIY